MIVGGYAYARYTEPRATKDFDLFLRADPQNAMLVYRALSQFGAFLGDVTVDDFAKSTTVFRLASLPFVSI